MLINHKLTKSGFSLLEMMLALGILGVIAVFAVSITHSTRNLTKISDTRNRMKEIRRAAVDYYSGHRDLPSPGGAVGSYEVPVEPSALNLEQKHRMDAWGSYFHYDRASQSATNPSSRTVITGIKVDDKKVAGVIISGGPNQTIESSNPDNSYSTAGDDIVLPISVAEQAFAIAMNDLEVLQAKAQAFDAIFAGINNNALSENAPAVVDEDGCIEVSGCPQIGTTNDPNCGTATLDSILSSYLFCSVSVDTPVQLIAGFYELGNSILLDPWLNGYAWGKPLDCGVADSCYHKFFSYGPDGDLGGGDDIVP